MLLWLWDWRYWKIRETKKPTISPSTVVWYALFAVAIVVTVTMSVGGTSKTILHQL